MIILTILNTIAILYLILRKTRFYIDMRKEKTFSRNTLVGYIFTLWRKNNDFSSQGIYSIYIPIKNKKKVELKEDIESMLKDKINRTHSLHAKFSWLKTIKEVEQFEKDYSIVDKEIVEKLVSGFKAKQTINK